MYVRRRRRVRGAVVARAQHRGAAAARLRAVGRHPAIPAAQLRRAQPRLLTAAQPSIQTHRHMDSNKYTDKLLTIDAERFLTHTYP